MMMMRYGPRMELDFEILAMGWVSFVHVDIKVYFVLLLKEKSAQYAHTITKPYINLSTQNLHHLPDEHG